MIWLIGNKGMLGTELSLLLEKAGLPFIGSDKEVDITDPAALIQFTLAYQGERKIEWIINCAAYTAVDKAEDDGSLCSLLNTQGAANIAAAAKFCGATLVHISTDYVFDGKGNRPYTEDDPTSPIGVYGLTKRDGEIKVFEENPKSYILRTAWLYGRYWNNFVNTMLLLFKEREEVKVVNDQYGSPTWTFDLSQAICNLIQQIRDRKSIPFGIYHFTNEEICTWFTFAKYIYDEGRALNILTKPCEIKPCNSEEYPAKVKRPAYSVLDKTKIKRTLGLEIPEWKISLKNYLKLTMEQA